LILTLAVGILNKHLARGIPSVSCDSVKTLLTDHIIMFRRVGKQTMLYFLVTGIFFAFAIIVITWLAWVLAGAFGGDRLIVATLLTIVLAAAIRPLIEQGESALQRAIAQTMSRYRENFSQFTRETYTLTDQVDLTRAVNAFLKNSLGATFAEIMVLDETGTAFRSTVSPLRVLSLAALPPRGDSREHQVLEVDQLRQSCPSRDCEVLEHARGGYGVPLLAKEGPIALLLVGPQESGKPYTLDQTDFLTVFADGIALAIERNALVEKMRAEQIRMSKMEKLASLGRLTAGIAHEFRNPLNIISTSAQTILRNPDDLQLHRETGRYILEETDRLSRTVDEFLQFAKPHTPVWQQVIIGDVVESSLQSIRDAALVKEIQIETRIDPAVSRITTSPQHVERVLRNLCLNAIEAMPQRGRLTIAAVSHAPGTFSMSISDTGPGIPSHHHARLFDPFFTTKPGGTGLGLSIVFMLIQAIRGKISFSSSAQGTTFLIELPMDGNQP
jgi:signal transduction histidine kinase